MVSIRFTRGRRALASCALVSVALIASGCGGGGVSTSDGPPPRAAHPARHAHHSHSSSTSSSTTSADPSTSSSTTTTASTSTADLPGTGKPTVTIGDKNYTEQFVLGQLYQQALQAQGYTVEINQNIGPTEVTLQALKSGALAMYPEYLYLLNSAIGHSVHGHATAQDAYTAAEHAAASRGLVLLDMTPFSDTFGIAVTDAYGASHRLHSLEDLRRVQETLTIGGEAQLQDAATGLPRLGSVYGVKPASFKALATGDQYGDLNDGTVQAAFVNTTDGELATGNYRLLRDPKRIFGFGNVVPVVSQAAMNKEGPAFATTIDRVDALLTTRTMRLLNLQVSAGGASAGDVAKQFLQTHGLIPVGSS